MSTKSKSPRPLKIFLCHSSDDKFPVRELFAQLSADGFDPWLDEENLLPGQHWEQEIPKAVKNSDVVIVCLSQRSINKSGYVQKEIRFALDVAEMQPEGTIFIIPLKLEQCEIPERLRNLQWVNLFEKNGYDKLKKSLLIRSSELINIEPHKKTLDSTFLQSNSNSKSENKIPQKDDNSFNQNLAVFLNSSPLASWIFGGLLLIFLIWIVFFLPTLTADQKSIIRFLIALAAGFFSVFFVGGVLLKGTLKGLVLSATGGFALFILIQFIFDPFEITNKQAPTGNNPIPNSSSTSNISPKQNGILVKSKYSPTVYYIEHGQRRPIPITNIKALEDLGRLEDIIVLPDNELNAIPVGPPKNLPVITPKPSQVSTTPTPEYGDDVPYLIQTVWKEENDSYKKIEFKNSGVLFIQYYEEGKLSRTWNGKWYGFVKDIVLTNLIEPDSGAEYRCFFKNNKMQCSQIASTVATNYSINITFTKVKM